MINKRNKEKIMKNIKFKAFVAIGVVAVGVLSASMYQTAQADNISNEAREVAVCEVMVAKVTDRIAHPLMKGDLNTSLGLQLATAQDHIQQKLEQTNPQKVSCNIKSIRNNFLNKVNNIDRPQISPSYTTPG